MMIVKEFLNTQNLGHLSECFEKNDITGKVFQKMTESDFIDIGITKQGNIVNL